MHGVVLGLHVNPNGGVPKHPVETLDVRPDGCVGDRQNDRRHHGGPTRAVCIMEERVMRRLQEQGHPIHPGSTGENLLVGGLEAEALRVGSVLRIGALVLRITGDAPPCKTIKASFQRDEFRALSHKVNPGNTRWYAEVCEASTIALGDEVVLVNGDEPAGNQ